MVIPFILFYLEFKILVIVKLYFRICKPERLFK